MKDFDHGHGSVCHWPGRWRAAGRAMLARNQRGVQPRSRPEAPPQPDARTGRGRHPAQHAGRTHPHSRPRSSPAREASTRRRSRRSSHPCTRACTAAAMPRGLTDDGCDAAHRRASAAASRKRPARCTAARFRQGNARARLARWGQLKTERATWVAHWQEITTYMLPRQGRYFVQDRNRGGQAPQLDLRQHAARARCTRWRPASWAASPAPRGRGFAWARASPT
jgi:hypothetical protein